MAPDGESIACDVVCGAVIDDPRDDGLEVLVWLVETCHAVVERRRVGKKVDGAGAGSEVCGVVRGDSGPDIEENAGVGEYSQSAGAGSVAGSEGLDEPVAAGCWMCTDPVVPRLLICLDDDCVTLS